MWFYIFLALTCGLLIGLSRVVNSRLGRRLGPMGSSTWNHFVGFAFLLVFVVAAMGFEFIHSIDQVPAVLYLGGVIGALFVAINSWVIPHLGAMQSALLVISGEMLAGTLIDLWAGKITSPLMACLGAALVVAGMKVSQARKS